MYPTPPTQRGGVHRRKMRFCGPSNLNGQVPVVHSGTQEFYIGDEGEEEATIVFFVFFPHVFPSFLDCGRNRSQTNGKHMSWAIKQQNFQLVQVIVLSSFVTIRLAKKNKQFRKKSYTHIYIYIYITTFHASISWVVGFLLGSRSNACCNLSTTWESPVTPGRTPERRLQIRQRPLQNTRQQWIVPGDF